MDFEFALWQMLYLFISPQKVYRNFGYRRGGFLVDLMVWEDESFEIVELYKSFEN
jgi:hypothetical protein